MSSIQTSAPHSGERISVYVWELPVRIWLDAQPGWRVVDLVPSPIRGGSGNEELLIGARRDD